MEISAIHKLFLECSNLVIDTKKIIPNSMYLALKGDRFDGNTFVQKALENGAKYAIIDNKEYFVDSRTVLVENTLETLQKLATFHRLFLNIPIIALTGSNGKTTTKELIHCVLLKKFNTKATFGNLNNHIGVPLTVLSFDSKTEIGIVEMGANHQKEIEQLCEIARPDYGYITNFGKAHLEGFGGVEGVIKGKSEMYIHLQNNHKFAFVNLDDDLQNQKTQHIERCTFSTTDTSADTFISGIEANPFVTISWNQIVIQSKLIGLYNANNINVAITIGQFFGISNNDIKNGLESYIPENNRSQIVVKGSNEVILDAYNANPSSVKVAIENFVGLQKTNKIAILGDMFELGSESFEEHQMIVQQVQNQSDFVCYFVGSDFNKAKISKPNMYFFETFELFESHINAQKPKNSFLLVKGSRGMALERILELL